MIILPLVITGASSQEVSRLFSQSVLAKFATIVLVGFFTIYLLSLYLKAKKSSFKSIGLLKPKLSDFGNALVALGVYYVLFVIVTSVVYSLFPSFDINQKQEIGFSTDVRAVLLPLVFVSLVVVPAVSEEILCRGFLYSGLRTKLPKIIAAIITSVLFAAAHLQWGSGNALLWIAAVDTFILSLVLVYLREKTGSLTSPILLHGFKNSLAFVVLFIVNR